MRQGAAGAITANGIICGAPNIRNYSKWFTRYRQDVGLYVKMRDFHSFRHSATTFLRHGVDDATIDELTGHATAGETARYTKGVAVANLASAVDKISIGVDLSPLHITTK